MVCEAARAEEGESRPGMILEVRNTLWLKVVG